MTGSDTRRRRARDPSRDRPARRSSERDPRGALGLLADRDRGVLVGAWAIAPLASEWIHYAALAIRAQIPISVLLDQVAQYPTYTEAYLAALEKLSLSRTPDTQVTVFALAWWCRQA